LNDHPEPKEQYSNTSDGIENRNEAGSIDIGREFLWARFQHNRDKLQKNPEFNTLFAKQEDWTDEDVKKFMSLIGQFTL